MNDLNQRIASANSERRDERPDLEIVTETVEKFTSHLARRGHWRRCGFVPRGKGFNRNASELRSTGIVEWDEVSDPTGGRGFVLPDVRLSRVLTAAEKAGTGEALYLSEDGLLCHYGTDDGTATPCLKIDDKVAFRPEYSVPHRGSVVDFDELERKLDGRG